MKSAPSSHAARFTPEVLATLTVKEETIDDALAAVALLHQTEGIDPARIFVLGHSLGGYLLPRIALAGPGFRPWPDRWPGSSWPGRCGRWKRSPSSR